MSKQPFNYEHCVKVDGGEARHMPSGNVGKVLAAPNDAGGLPMKLNGELHWCAVFQYDLANITAPPSPMPKELAVWVKRAATDGSFCAWASSAEAVNNLIPDYERHLIRPGTLDPQELWELHGLVVATTGNDWAVWSKAAHEFLAGLYPTYTDALIAASAYARKKASKA